MARDVGEFHRSRRTGHTEVGEQREASEILSVNDGTLVCRDCGCVSVDTVNCFGVKYFRCASRSQSVGVLRIQSITGVGIIFIH